MTQDWIRGGALLAAACVFAWGAKAQTGEPPPVGASLLSFHAAGLQDPAPQDPQDPTIDVRELLRRLDEQDARIKELEGRDEERAKSIAELEEAEEKNEPKFEIFYKNGFVLRSTEAAETPFQLEIGGRMQFRYTAFGVDRKPYRNLETDASGNPIRRDDLNQFEIERARLSFGGMWLNPKFHFYINIDADTDDNHQAIFHDFWVNYDFDKGFRLYVGKAFVPGSRSWLDGSLRTHLADRAMATTFFRPDRTVGVWAIGEPIEDFHYRVMIGNGLATSDLAPDEINNRLAYAASVWFDPCGDFGKGYADLEHHEDPVSRVGASFAFAEQSGVSGNSALAETRFLRLSDGSRLTSLGVNHADEYLLAVDAALKWQGFSIHGEGYFRWLRDIEPTGAPVANFPHSGQDDTGFYVDAGYFFIQETLETVVRYSAVYGSQKDSSEYACAVNWYIDGGGHRNKLTLEGAWFDGSPVTNSGANYRVGDDGFRLILQWQIDF